MIQIRQEILYCEHSQEMIIRMCALWFLPHWYHNLCRTSQEIVMWLSPWILHNWHAICSLYTVYMAALLITIYCGSLWFSKFSGNGYCSLYVSVLHSMLAARNITYYAWIATLYSELYSINTFIENIYTVKKMLQRSKLLQECYLKLKMTSICCVSQMTWISRGSTLINCYVVHMNQKCVTYFFMENNKLNVKWRSISVIANSTVQQWVRLKPH